jgi:hypothetical protein
MRKAAHPDSSTNDAPEAGASLVSLVPSPELGAEIVDGVRYDIVGGRVRVPEELVPYFEALGCTREEA